MDLCLWGQEGCSFRFVNALIEFNAMYPLRTTLSQGRNSATLDRILQRGKTIHKKDLNHIRHFTILYKVTMVDLRLVPLMFDRGLFHPG